MTMTPSGLRELIYRYYPRGVMHIARIHLAPGEIYFGDTEEHRRLVEIANRGRAEYSTWQAMVRRLGQRYRVQNESMHLFAGGTDPAYSARIWLTNDIALSFHVSLLGPFYGVHLPGIPEEVPVAIDVVREIEATYPGYQQIPPEIGDEPVPDIEAGVQFGKETIYTCLFSIVWTWVDPV